MASPTGSRVSQFTIRFNLKNAEQERALSIYEDLLKEDGTAQSLASLLVKTLTVFSEQAKDHPALCNRTARLIAKHQDKVLALLRALEAGQEIPGLEVEPPQAIATTPQPVSASDIEVDFSQL